MIRASPVDEFIRSLVGEVSCDAWNISLVMSDGSLSMTSPTSHVFPPLNPLLSVLPAFARWHMHADVVPSELPKVRVAIHVELHRQTYRLPGFKRTKGLRWPKGLGYN